MTDTITSERLTIERLSVNDAAFIFKLLNSKEWIDNIGNRNIVTQDDALNYIKKVNAVDDFYFWTVRIGEIPIGIITLLKKEYLPCPDIGFAFLKEYSGKGYAFEASKAVIDQVVHKHNIAPVCAVTIKENTRSQKLLKRLGLNRQGTITLENEELELFMLPDKN